MVQMNGSAYPLCFLSYLRSTGQHADQNFTVDPPGSASTNRPCLRGAHRQGVSLIRMPI